MIIRVRAILVIFLTTLVIISFSILTGIITVRNRIEISQESALMLMSDIADHFISGEIKTLKLKAAGAARFLSTFEEARWPDILSDLNNRHTEFVGIAVWDEGRGLIASAGKTPMPVEAMDDRHIRKAFLGKETISTTITSPDGLMFYLAAPLPGIPDKILALTLPHTYFSELVSTFIIWETGHLFIDDAEGRLVSNIRPEWVENRVDFIQMARIDPSHENIVKNLRRGLENKAEIIRYSIFDVPRLCVYRPVSGSEEGWLFGTVAPLTESPFRYINSELIVIGAVSLFLSLIVAVIASGFIKRPFDKIAELKEEAEKNSRFKSEFLAMMSHEIRTPMNSIMGFAELALGTLEIDTAPRLKDYLGKIKDSTKRLLKIINDILDIAKIESGKMELENTPFDLCGVFMQCQSVVLPHVVEKKLELHVCSEPMPGKKLLGDPTRLYQALLNLLSNAVKFTDSGIIKLSSLVKNSEGNNVTVYFEVKDAGIGMTPEQVEKIFNPFIQAEFSTTRNYGGTGLGLSITKNIVELMGGRLSVESSPGAGSVFSFEIMFETIAVSEDGSDRVKLDSIEKPHFDGLILVCDDNSMNQQVMCGHLSSVGLRTVVADNGKEGVEKVRERLQSGGKPFDLILMDIFMPVLDGIDAAKQITELNTGTPIVAVTANVMTSEIEKYKKHGMPEHLGKPFTSQELWRTLLKFLTPVSTSVVDEAEQERSKNEMQQTLRINFVMKNQTRYDEIAKAIASGNWELAHRLTHTLKSNAGFIGKTGLQSVAAEIEALILGGTLTIPEEKMALLETELASVLEELKSLLPDELASRENTRTLNSEQISELFEKLELLFEDRSPDCMNYLADIRAVPGAEELARHMEYFDFESAVKALDELRRQRPD